MKNFLKSKGLGNWLPAFFAQQLIKKRPKNYLNPRHILLCFVDHYEPFQGKANYGVAQGRVKSLVEHYPKMASKHHDSDGIHPLHTWFYPPHHDHSFLADLLLLCKEGYGEIEMHLHHNHMHPFPDTGETFKSKVLRCIDDYSEYKIFCLPDGKKKFAFIHGDWSLNNSKGDKICGINNETAILKECGCFADFTFPSLGESQPAMINKIYYTKSTKDKPKSHNWGREVVVDGQEWGDLLIITGIIGLRWKSRTHRFKPSIEASNIDKSDYPFDDRIDYWVKNAVRINGRPDWLFIKIHTHGAREVDFDCIFGNKADTMYDYLEEHYNDGKRYMLHYVTAREMYNIIKSAEAGLKGNPAQYRNYLIPRYTYLP